MSDENVQGTPDSINTPAENQPEQGGDQGDQAGDVQPIEADTPPVHRPPLTLEERIAALEADYAGLKERLHAAGLR